MSELLGVLQQYGEGLVFLLVLLEQVGLPVPSLLALVGAGAMIGQGLLDPWIVGGSAVLAALAANYLWYRVGWAQGPRMLGRLCRISLDPDACVRLSETMMGRLGAGSLLVAKFIPGLNTLAAPMAGVLRLPLRRFWLLNGAGTVVWVATTLALGYLFSDRLESVAERLVDWGLGGGLVLGSLLGGWIGFKALQRWLMVRRLRGVRISVDELQALLANGTQPFVVDLRHAVHRAAVPHAIPGALHIAPSELVVRHGEVPRDRDVILYCS